MPKWYQRKKEGIQESAGFWIRFLATIMDWCVMFLVGWVLDFCWQMALGAVGAPVPGEKTMTYQYISGSISLVVTTLYYTYGHFLYGTTLGKYPLGVFVVDANSGGKLTLKQSFLRTVGYVVSYAAVGGGFLMVAWQPEKRGLHDLIAKTKSIYWSAV